MGIAATRENIENFARSVLDIDNNINRLIDQKTHFQEQVENINKATYDIRIVGYEKVFMSLPETIEALTNAVKGENRNSPILVRAIFPEGQGIQALDDLSKEIVNLGVQYIPDDIRIGFMTCDNASVFGWNLDELSANPVDKKNGVIARRSTQYLVMVKEKARLFDSLFQYLT